MTSATRTAALFVTAVAVGAVAVLAAPAIPSLLASSPCPDCNIVLVSVEPLRADHLGLYGYERRNTSPVIDSIGAEGQVFDGAFTVSGHTTEATFSTFTSLYPSQHDVNPVTPDRNGRASRLTYLAEALHDAGYRTVSVNGDADIWRSKGGARGFDRFTGGTADEWRDVTVDTLARDDRPFFLHLQSYAPHDPYFEDVPPDVLDRYTVNRSMRTEAADRWAALERRAEQDENFTRNDLYHTFRLDYYFDRMADSPVFREESIAQYDASIRYADTALGSVMAELRAAGELDDTIVVVMAQHGEMFGERGRWTHSSLFGPVVRVPLVIRAPGLEPGRVDGPVSTLDVAPTILDLAGVPASRFREQAEGRSLLPVIRGEADGRRFLFAEHYAGQRAVTDTRNRTKLYRSPDGSTSLFALSPNWTEQETVDDPATRRRLAAVLDAFRTRTGPGTQHGDTWPYFG